MCRAILLFHLYVPLIIMSSRTRLDSIGIGGFAHDFGSLRGKTSPVVATFDSFGSIKPSFSTMLSFVFGMILPGLSTRIPSEHMRRFRSLASGIREIASELLDKATKEKAEVGEGEVEKSIIGALGEKCIFLMKKPRAEGE